MLAKAGWGILHVLALNGASLSLIPVPPNTLV